MKNRMFKVTVFILASWMIIMTAGAVFAEKKVEKPVEVVFWYFGGLDTELRLFPKMIEEFNRQNPGVVVKGTHFPWDTRDEKIMTGFRQKNLPDLITRDSMAVADLVGMGILVAFDVEFPDYYNSWEPKFIPEIWNQVSRLDGHKYGIGPYCSVGPMMIFDPELLESLGLEGVPETFEEFLEFARVVKQNGYIGVSLPASKATNDMMIFMDIVYANGGRWLSPDGEKVMINGPAWVETLKLYDQLNKEGLIQRGAMQTDYVDALKLTVQGKAGLGMGKDWINAIVYDLGAPAEKIFNLTRFPRKKPLPGEYTPVGLTLEGGSDMMMMSTSKVKDAAIKFVDYYASEEVLRNWGGDPVRGRTPASFVAYDNPAFKKYNPFLYQQFKAGTLFEDAIEAPNFRGLAEMYHILADAIHEVLLGDTTPQQALNKAQKQCQEVLDRYIQ